MFGIALKLISYRIDLKKNHINQTNGYKVIVNQIEVMTHQKL
jgi:hypothetical protein